MHPTTSIDRGRRRLLLAAAVLATALAGCSTTRPDAAVRQTLAPTGALRIAVYPGSPTSLVKAAPPAEMRGVTVDLGRALAQRLGVPAQVIVYPRVSEVLAALQHGEADFTVTNATAERSKLVDFAPPIVELELGVLVPAGSRVQATDRIDQAGVVIGVTQGSSSERVLSARLKQARLRTLPTLAAAAQALQQHDIDAYATNKGILFELADQVPGSRVLEGRWGEEHLAVAVPKGREAAHAWLEAFTAQVRADGSIQRAAQRAGLRGLVAPSH